MMYKSKERIKEYYRQYCKDNKEKIDEYSRQWKKNNPGYYKKYYESRNYYLRKRNKIDLKYNLNHRMGSAILKALKSNKNGRHWENLVGYTLNDLIKRLKQTMPEGYNWNDFLKGRLHIDHIMPKSVFNYNMPEHPDFKNCWALSNLQLLPAKDNIIKDVKLERPFQPALRIC